MGRLKHLARAVGELVLDSMGTLILCALGLGWALCVFTLAKGH